MRLESAIASLLYAVIGLQETVSALQVTIAEDKPAHGATVLVDQLDNLVTDLASTLNEAVVQAAEAHRSSKIAQLQQTRVALSDLHNLLNCFMTQYIGELAAHDRIAELLEMGRERGREWSEWSQEVKTAVERSAVPIKVMSDALAECWNELVQHLPQGSMALDVAKIDPLMNLREQQSEMAEIAGMRQSTRR